jgi:hypothetical protein
VARTVAEPVSFVKYHASAKPTTALPKTEKAWLIHNTKNFLIAVIPPWTINQKQGKMEQE